MRAWRLEGCATDKVLARTLRDAVLRTAPQGEVIVVATDGSYRGGNVTRESRSRFSR